VGDYTFEQVTAVVRAKFRFFVADNDHLHGDV
jgi:hypothetical protein